MSGADKAAASDGAPEIEITPEMLEAGVSVFYDFGEDLSLRDFGPGDSRHLVMEILKASLSAK